jgi:hypothetical protein
LPLRDSAAQVCAEALSSRQRSRRMADVMKKLSSWAGFLEDDDMAMLLVCFHSW